jgi:uncharacterized membrane protein
MVKPRRDLALVVVAALAACLSAALLPSSLAGLRAPLSLPLVLLLPGYAVVSAIFRPGELRTAELITLSIAVSIAATLIVALALDALGVKLTAAPWMGVLTVLTLAAAARGTARGHSRSLILRPIPVGRAQVGAIAAGLALLAGAATLGFTPLGAPNGTRGTSALWLLPAPGGLQAVCVGVINEQLHTTTYNVTVRGGGGPVRRLGPIVLEPGKSWSRELAVASSAAPVMHAFLRRAAEPSVVYRSVVLRDWNIAATGC